MMVLKLQKKIWSYEVPGEIEGTKQSGLLNFKLASIVNDKDLLETAKYYAEMILDNDEELTKPENADLKKYLLSQKGKTAWSKIS